MPEYWVATVSPDSTSTNNRDRDSASTKKLEMFEKVLCPLHL